LCPGRKERMRRLMSVISSGRGGTSNRQLSRMPMRANNSPGAAYPVSVSISETRPHGQSS
jgi:hypothetical protein